jgi:sugar phosphate permease
VRRYRWVILGAGTLAQSTFSAASVGLSALGPVLRSHYHLSLGQVGIVLGAVSFGMLPTLLPWGLLADRIGERAVIGLGLGSGGIAMMAIAFTTSYGALLALLVLFGALGSSINAASGRAVMGWFSEEQRGLALGIRQTAVPIGGAAAAIGLPWLAASGNPSHAFLALGAGALAGAAVGALLLREAPVRAEIDLADVARPLRDLRNWLLATGSGLFVVAQIALTNYPVLFLHEHRGLTTHSAAFVLAAMNVLGIGARIAAGRWSDHVRSRIGPLRMLGLLIAGGTAAVALLVDAPLAVLVPVLVVAGVLSLSWNGVAFTAAAEMAGTGKSGAALGFQQTVLGVLASVATPAFAALVVVTSWRVAFLVAAVFPAVGLLALRWVAGVTSGAARSRGTSAIPPAAP